MVPLPAFCQDVRCASDSGKSQGTTASIEACMSDNSAALRGVTLCEHAVHRVPFWDVMLSLTPSPG